MKVIVYIMRSTNWVVAIFCGIFGFMWFANMIDLGLVGQIANDVNLNNPSLRIILVVLAAYLVLFNLLYIVGGLFTRKYATHIKLDIVQGGFSIALSAIENSLRRAIRQLPDVHDVHVRIYKDKKSEIKPVRIHASFSTWEGIKVKEVTEKIQGVIRMRFNEIIEVKEPPIFDIALVNIVDKESKKAESRKKEKGLPGREKMFYGPEYPIDSE